MGQVPASSTFLIIGDGRLARHLRRYLQLENLPYRTWSRRGHAPEDLRATDATHVLLAIGDHAIEGFVHEHSYLLDRVCVHFSGAMTFPAIPGAHPLMTFAEAPYTLEIYRQIPFVLERERGTLASLLPGLSNPAYEIDADKKALYHALCVLSGNFTVLLWEKAFTEFSTRLGLPKEVLLPYLRQTAENLARAPADQTVLTGPLARGDHATIAGHLTVLENDPFRDVYQAFVATRRTT